MTTLQMFRTLALYALVTTLTLVAISIASAVHAKTGYAKSSDLPYEVHGLACRSS